MRTPVTKKFEHLEQEVLKLIINIHGERGERIVEYLNTAHQLLEIKEDLISMNFNLPKLPETIAYCIREALTEALKGVRKKHELLKFASKVVTTKEDYQNNLELSEDQRRVAHGKMLRAIDELQIAKEQFKNKDKMSLRNLLNDNNLTPENPEEIIKRYDDLIIQTQRGLHKKTSEKEVEEMWAECLSVHKDIYSNLKSSLQINQR